MYRPGANRLAFSTFGVERLRIRNNDLDVFVPTINTSSQDSDLEIISNSTSAFAIKESGGNNLITFDTLNDTLDISENDTILNIRNGQVNSFSIKNNGDEFIRCNTNDDRILIFKDLFIKTDTVDTTEQDTNIVIRNGSTESLTIETSADEYMTFDTDDVRVVIKQRIEFLNDSIDMRNQATDFELNTNSSTALEIWDGNSATGTRMMVFDTTASRSITSDVPLYIDDTTDSSSSSTGAFVVDGGVGIAKKLSVDGETTFNSNVYFGDKIFPITTDPSGDNFISIQGSNETRRWLRFRGGGSPFGEGGIVISEYDGDNYFIFGHNTTGSLRINYSSTVDYSASSNIFKLESNGNLTITGTYTPFTGSHISSNNINNIEDGLILSSDSKNTKYNTIINSNIYTKISNIHKDKNVLGVSYFSNNNLQIVSVGEGGMQVCTEVINNIVQTPINGGDYICSYFDGYGTVQNDDLLHSYTVAKSLQDYDFSKDYTEFTKDNKTYRKGFIAVSFHCG